LAAAEAGGASMARNTTTSSRSEKKTFTAQTSQIDLHEGE
jgi:hypothetical protein